MTTLDDLLARLPDNDTGAIDASDLRYIVTEIWTRLDDLEAEVQAIETGGGTLSVTGRWQVNAQPGVVPGGMQVTADTATLVDASWLRFSKIGQGNIDATVALLSAQKIYGQMQSNAGTWARAVVSGTPTEYAEYVEIPVQYEDGAGSMETAAWQAAVVVLSWSV